MGEKWEGGDMNYPGGGWKVNLLKQELEKVSIIFDLWSYWGDAGRFRTRIYPKLYIIQYTEPVTVLSDETRKQLLNN